MRLPFNNMHRLHLLSLEYLEGLGYNIGAGVVVSVCYLFLLNNGNKYEFNSLMLFRACMF